MSAATPVGEGSPHSSSPPRPAPFPSGQGLLDEFGVAPEAECYRVTWGKGKDRSFRGTCALLEMLWHTVLGEPARYTSVQTIGLTFTVLSFHISIYIYLSIHLDIYLSIYVYICIYMCI